MKVAFLGTGVMAEAILAGLVASGFPASDLTVTVRRPERGRELADRYAVAVLSNADAVAWADVVVLAVKPQGFPELLEEIASSVRTDQVVVSIAAGVTTPSLEERLPATVIRVMPNTPAQVGAGVHGLARGSRATDAQVQAVTGLLSTSGVVVEVPEADIDALAAVSGSGPAYFFLVVEAITDAGMRLGLTHDVAAKLARATAYGAGKLMMESADEAEVLRAKVTSKKGMTAEAIEVLEQRGIRAIFADALEAARDRARELAAGT